MMKFKEIYNLIPKDSRILKQISHCNTTLDYKIKGFQAGEEIIYKTDKLYTVQSGLIAVMTTDPENEVCMGFLKREETLFSFLFEDNIRYCAVSDVRLQEYEETQFFEVLKSDPFLIDAFLEILHMQHLSRASYSLQFSKKIEDRVLLLLEELTLFHKGKTKYMYDGVTVKLIASYVGASTRTVREIITNLAKRKVIRYQKGMVKALIYV